MLILAKSAKGQEFIYSPSSAHKVSKRSAAAIRDALNSISYQLKDGQTWYIHDVDQYDDASIYAESQSFIIRRGALKEVRA